MNTLKSLSLIVLAAGLTLTSCNKKEPAATKSNGLPKATTTAKADAQSGPVAVVDIDSLATQCTFCKDGQAQLQAKQKSLQAQLNTKMSALQTAMNKYQQDIQNGTINSEAQAKQAQTKLQNQQNSLQQFQAQIEEQMNTATVNYQNTLREKIATFLKEYNKDGRFKVIISKSGDNVLYTDPTVDITADVVAGLNAMEKK